MLAWSSIFFIFSSDIYWLSYAVPCLPSVLINIYLILIHKPWSYCLLLSRSASFFNSEDIVGTVSDSNPIADLKYLIFHITHRGIRINIAWESLWKKPSTDLKIFFGRKFLSSNKGNLKTKWLLNVSCWTKCLKLVNLNLCVLLKLIFWEFF